MKEYVIVCGKGWLHFGRDANKDVSSLTITYDENKAYTYHKPGFLKEFLHTVRFFIYFDAYVAERTSGSYIYTKVE